MKYNLDHLTQSAEQAVRGPIQDDEALLLYGFIKTTLVRNVVELGFAFGYSARNFLAAVGPKGKVVSIDTSPVTKLTDNHYNITKNAADVLPEEIPFEIIDLVFYDTHDYNSTVNFHNKMIDANKITKTTTIVLHDTGLYPKRNNNCVQTNQGWVHQPTERNICNLLITEGWHAIHAHGLLKNFDSNEVITARHGLTFLQKETFLL